MRRRIVPKSTGLIVALNLVLGLFMTTNARAQPCNKEDKAKAQALIKQGTKFLRERKARLAVAAFKQAYRHCKARAIQFNLALAYRVLGDLVVSATHLRRYLAGGAPDERKALPPPLQQLLLEVGVLRVQVRLAKATVWVDGRLAGSGRVEVVVLPGSRAVEIRLGDRVLKHKKLDVSGGQTVVWSPNIVVPLRPTPQLPPPNKVQQRGIHWAYFLSIAIVAAVGGAALTYTGIRTLQLRTDYVANPTYTVEKDFDRHKLTSNVLVGVTAAAGATAVVIAIFTRWRRRREEKPGFSVIPSVVRRGTCLTIHGRF